MRYCGNCARLLEELQDIKSQPVSAPASQTISFENQIDLESARRFKRAGLHSLGQHRRVTILFADLSRYSALAKYLEQDALYELLQELLKQLVDLVYKYEGMVDKIMGDGIMAVFGAPVSLENHSERAVRAALEMRSLVREISWPRHNQLKYELNLHIGINEGEVIVGAVGSDQRMDYTAIGETVNLASRLLAAAGEDEILVSESVFRSTKNLFHYSDPAHLQLKGYQTQVAAFRLLGDKAQPVPVRGIEGLAAPMVGRQRELSLLNSAAQALINSKKSQFVLVTGEAGIGKSRLKAEFRGQLKNQPVLFVEGQTLTYRRSVPYWIFKNLIFDYLKLPSNADPSLIKKRLFATLEGQLNEYSDDILPFLEHLLLYEQKEEENDSRFALLEPEKIRDGIFQSVRELLLAEANRQPLILILEDLHWADDASLDLLRFLVETTRQVPIMVLALSRPDIADTVSSLFTKPSSSFLHIHLTHLTLLESEQLFAELLKIPEFPEYFHQLVLKRAEGIPFYLEEILRMLIEEKVIEFREGHWQMAGEMELAALRVPGNLQNLILARFDKLSPAHRKILQAAAVIGSEFQTSILLGVQPEFTEKRLMEILDDLEKREFINQPTRKQGGYQFRHALVSDCVYATLLRREKETLHGRVAEVIENRSADNLDSQVEILAGHYLRSPSKEKALHYLLLAGRKASREYANQQSCQHFMEAAALLPHVRHTPEQARQVWSGYGDVLTFIGDYPTAREKYQEALNIFAGGVSAEEELLALRERSSLHRKIATTFERQGEFDKALQQLEAGLQLLDETIIPSPDEKASIYNSMGWIYFLQGRFSEARSVLSTALKLVEGSKHLDIVASVHNRLGAVAYQERSYYESEMHVSESLILRERIRDRAGVARLYNNLGLLGLMQGNLRMAEENFLKGASLLERTGDAEGIALSNINLGLVKIDRGELETAGTYLARAIQAAEQIGHRYYLALAKMYIGRINTEIDEFAAAERCLTESLNIFTELGSADGCVDSIFYLAENYLACNDLTNALAYTVRAQEELNNSISEFGVKAVQQGRVLRLLGKIAQREQKFNDARIHLEESDRVFSQSSEKLELGRTYLELGLLAESQKYTSQAKGYFQRAYLIFDQLGAEREAERVKTKFQQHTQ